ncbi:VWA domain-containing protein [bacterium]|nr:VWA domain-containing protein [bacterium]
MKRRIGLWFLSLFFILFPQMPAFGGKPNPRLVMFVGVDISGSFLRGQYFEDSMDFLAQYIYAHVNGVGGLEVPHSLFVGSIGGDKVDEPKTLFPIQTFQNQSVDQIRTRLASMFPKTKSNPFTDFNAFFEQIRQTVDNRALLMRPVSIVMISDGKPDVPGKSGRDAMRTIKLKPLENLSRNVTLRLLYTDAVTGASWQNDVPRQRVKVWTQDAQVMTEWKRPNILKKGRNLASQDRLFSWIKDNVDFGVRTRSVK